ncbi:MAG TPA: hypothetical protein VG944_16145 [Fimbriimonas sp.]|nr:hypothetical protein [Fimbriimonas sp.]
MEAKTTTHGMSGEREQAFHGYSPPTSSTTYTPNQFFDVVLPHASRGCLRLVGYLIRKTLGWSDAEGNPQNPEAYVSYRELIDTAGISRGAIKDAIQEALDKRFITCLKLGQPHRANEEGFSALYSLKWDEREKYIADPEDFDGFFAGNGNLTHIPNAFFDYSIPNEPLAVIQVVGVIIRNTIGWQSKFGMRRQKIEMSFSEIMRRTGSGSRTTVSNALKAAIDGYHIRRVERGVFDPNAGADSKATVYAIRWTDDEPRKSAEIPQLSLFELENGDGSKSGPEIPNDSKPLKPTVQKLDRSSTVQKVDRGIGSESGPANGPETGPASVQNVDSNEFKKRTDIKTTNLNNTSKQHQTGLDDVDAGGRSLSLLSGRLIREGVDPVVATQLVEKYSAERIQQQIDWLGSRNIRSSKTGFLIRAIERDMAPPAVQTSERPGGWHFAAHFYAELAGNKGEPTAEPSMEEIRLGEAFLQRTSLAHIPENAGRRFGAHVSAVEASRTSPTRTLTLALRLYGDEFFASQATRRDEDQKQAIAAARAAHETAMGAEYIRAVKEILDDLCQDVETGMQFEAYIEDRLKSRRRMSERAHQMMEDQLRTDEGRIEVFREFAEKTRPGAIPTFWEWDAKMSRKPFSMEGKL